MGRRKGLGSGKGCVTSKLARVLDVFVVKSPTTSITPGVTTRPNLIEEFLGVIPPTPEDRERPVPVTPVYPRGLENRQVFHSRIKSRPVRPYPPGR